MKPLHRQLLRWFAWGALVVAVSGCHPASLDDKIDARNDAAFESWIAERARLLTPGEIREINDARQTIRYKIMQAHLGAPAEEIAEALYAEIAGKTPRQLLIAGYELQVERMKIDLANYQPLLAKFSNYGRDQPLTDDNRQVANEGLEKLHRLIQEHQDKLNQFAQRLAELQAQEAAAARQP